MNNGLSCPTNFTPAILSQMSLQIIKTGIPKTVNFGLVFKKKYCEEIYFLKLKTIIIKGSFSAFASKELKEPHIPPWVRDKHSQFK